MRRILRHVVTAMVLLGASNRVLSADELSRSDKLRVLYSNQFAFDRRSVPLVSVRIGEKTTEAVIESSAALRVLPDGEDGSEVSGGKRWRITLTHAKPGVVDHFVVLAREPFAALAKLRQEMALWQQRGVRCQLIEIGTVFGVKGNVFDNRAYVLAGGPHASRGEALQQAERFAKTYGLARVATLPQLRKRPSGTFEATDLETSARVKAKDVIWFAPAKDERLSVRVGSNKARAYWGQIYTTVDTDGAMAVVNAVPAERLLAGLVPAEIFPQAPRAALQAQAVAARGELLAKIGTHHVADPYLLCSTQHCQVYAGADQENPRTTEAVSSTKGMVLVRKDGTLADTVYSASCGGYTEHNDNVWPVKPDPNLRGHLDAEPGAPTLARFSKGITESSLESWLEPQPKTYCGGNHFNKEKHRWTVRIPLAKLNGLVQKLGVGSVKAIRVLKRGQSGRVNLLLIEGQSGTQQVRGELDIRQLFGGLRSSMFSVKAVGGSESRPTEFIFHGGGWGHGVGMCQTGAIGMAEAGKTYQEILRHYYQGSELKPLY
jgi:stage II sporulation protein D